MRGTWLGVAASCVSVLAACESRMSVAPGAFGGNAGGEADAGTPPTGTGGGAGSETGVGGGAELVDPIVIPKLNCPRAEAVIGGTLKEMLQGGDYKPATKGTAWYQGVLSFDIEEQSH